MLDTREKIIGVLSFGIFFAIFFLAMYVMIQFQLIDNEYGPPGPSTIGAPVPLYIDPLWKYAVWTALLPAVWLFDHYYLKKRRRRKLLLLHGHCLTCGYDLRATQNRCPECGNVPKNRFVSI